MSVAGVFRAWRLLGVWLVCVVLLYPSVVLGRSVRATCRERGAGQVTLLHPRQERIPRNARFLIDRWSRCTRNRTLSEFHRVSPSPVPYGEARLVDVRGRVIPVRVVTTSFSVKSYDVNALHIMKPKFPDERVVWLVPEGLLPTGRVVLEQRTPVAVGEMERGVWTTRGVAWTPVRAFDVESSSDHTPPSPPMLARVWDECTSADVYYDSWSRSEWLWGRALIGTQARDQRAGGGLLYVLERRRVRSGLRVVSDPWEPVSAFIYRDGEATYVHPVSGYGWDGAWERPHELHMRRDATLHIHRVQDALMDRWAYRLHALDAAGNRATSPEVLTPAVTCDARVHSTHPVLVAWFEQVEHLMRSARVYCRNKVFHRGWGGMYLMNLLRSHPEEAYLYQLPWLYDLMRSLSWWCSGSERCVLLADVVDELLLSRLEPEHLERLLAWFSWPGEDASVRAQEGGR